MKKIILFGLMLLIIPAVFAGVDVTPENPDTLDDLNCAVDLPGITDYLVTWFMNGEDTNIEITVVDHSLTRKNQVWECKVRKYYPYAGLVPLGSDFVAIENTPPFLAKIPDIIVNETENVTIITNASDVDNELFLTYTINDTRFTETSTGIFVWTTTYDDAGVYKFKVTVADTDNANYSQIVDVTVLNVNRPPVIANVTVVPATAYANDTLECVGNYSDPDNETESGSSFRWFNNSVEIPGETSRTLSNAFAKNDVISCEYTPRDGADFGAAVNSTNAATILNSIPYFNPALENKTVAENSTLEYTVHCDDADNDIMTYSDDSAQWDINASTGLISWTPGILDEGYYTYTITCSDGDNATSDMFSINVTGTNTRPAANITAPADNSTFEQGDMISFAGIGDDLEDGALTGDSLVWSSDIDGNFGNGTAVDYDNLSVGSHTITLTATDSGGLSGNDVIHVNITVFIPDTGNVVINEFMADGPGDDWVELYNNDSMTIEIGDWELHDSTSSMHVIPLGTTLGAGGFYVANVSNRLDNAGDTITLYNSTGSVMDVYTYSSPLADVSIGRFPDGAGDWYNLTIATPGSANMYGSLVIDSWIDAVFYSGSGYYHNITGIVDSIINISNITAVVDVRISDIFNSVIINSPIDNCTVLNSRLENTACKDAYIDPSTIINSNTTGSTIINSNITDSNATYSDITDSDINACSIDNSTVDNSILNGITLTDGNLTDNVIYSGVIDWGTGSYDATTNGPENLTDIINYPPVALFSVSSSSIIVGDSVDFDASASYDLNEGGDLNDTLIYFWDFGDGNNETTNSTTTSHTYNTANSYTASLTVTDSFGLSDSDSTIIIVSASDGGDGGSSGGGGGGSRAVTHIANFTNGTYTKRIDQGDRIRFDLCNDTHYLRLRQALEDYARFVLSSEIVYFNIGVNETTDMDLNNDSINDISITLNDCNRYRDAEVTLTLITEEIPEPEEEEPSDEEEPADEEPEPQEEEEETDEFEDEGWADYIPKKIAEPVIGLGAITGRIWDVAKGVAYRVPYLRYVIAGIVILVIIILVLHFRDKGKGKRKKNKKNNAVNNIGSWFADLFFENGKKKNKRKRAK